MWLCTNLCGYLARLRVYAAIVELRVFVRKTSTTQIFLIVWLQSDNELPMSEMQKKLGGHRLQLRNKARGKLPQF